MATEFKYELVEGAGCSRHIFSAVDERGGMHFWVQRSAIMDYGQKHFGGVECHYRSPPEYMSDHRGGGGDKCWLLDAPCWHDGSSLLASEKWIPIWEYDPDDHQAIFRLLAERMDSTFGKTIMKTSEKAYELEMAAAMLNDELGEYWHYLARLHSRCRDCASDEFQRAYDAEVHREYDRFKTEFVVVQEVETTTREVQSLRHIDE